MIRHFAELLMIAAVGLGAGVASKPAHAMQPIPGELCCRGAP